MDTPILLLTILFFYIAGCALACATTTQPTRLKEKESTSHLPNAEININRCTEYYYGTFAPEYHFALVH